MSRKLPDASAPPDKSSSKSIEVVAANTYMLHFRHNLKISQICSIFSISNLDRPCIDRNRPKSDIRLLYAASKVTVARSDGPPGRGYVRTTRRPYVVVTVTAADLALDDT
jgi:hypothetical protein